MPTGCQVVTMHHITTSRIQVLEVFSQPPVWHQLHCYVVSGHSRICLHSQRSLPNPEKTHTLYTLSYVLEGFISQAVVLQKVLLSFQLCVSATINHSHKKSWVQHPSSRRHSGPSHCSCADGSGICWGQCPLWSGTGRSWPWSSPASHWQSVSGA